MRRSRRCRRPSLDLPYALVKRTRLAFRQPPARRRSEPLEFEAIDLDREAAVAIVKADARRYHCGHAGRPSNVKQTGMADAGIAGKR
jgi:hypothetical protein